MTTQQSRSLGFHVADTLKLAWPVIAGQLGQILIGQVDNVMIGDLGPTELAAASLANGLFSLVMVFGFGICMALSPITSKAIGTNSPDEEKSAILMQGIRIIFFISLAIIGLIYLMIPALPYLGQAPAVLPLTRSYLILIAWSTLPMLLFLAMKHFIDGFGQTLPGMFFLMISVVLNILFNWIFIYGKWGSPALGLDGAGWATLLARLLGFVLFFIYLAKHPKFKYYLQWPTLVRVNKRVFRNILAIGIPSGLQYLFEVGAFSAAVILAGRIGEYEQSAHQIAISIAAFAYMFYMGISAAASIRIGYGHGRGNQLFIQRAGRAALLASLGCTIVFVTIIMAARTFLSEFYIDNRIVQELVFSLLIIAAVFQVFDGIQVVLQGMLRGVEDVKIPSFLAFTAYWLIGLPAAFILSEVLDYGLNGIWWALTIGLLFSAVLLSIRFWVITRAARSGVNG